MKNISIKSPIIYRGNEYIDNPEFVELEISTADMKFIKKCQTFLKENHEVVSIKIEALVTRFLDSENEEVDFAADVNDLVIYPTGNIYYYGQHKHDASAQIESNDISEELKNIAI